MSHEEAKVVEDTLENLVAELGTQKDKRTHTKFTSGNIVTDEELESMYRTDWVSGKIVDIIADDATREWRYFFESDNQEEIEDEEKRLGIRHAFNQAAKWSRLFGAGIILISVDDGKDPSEPLEIEKLREGSLRHIKVFDKTRINHTGVIDNNPMSENFGKPNHYTIHGSASRIHNSRLLRFDGIEVPFQTYVQNGYWHDSVLHRVYDSIINMSLAANGSASMIFESNVDIMKIDNLMSYLADDKGTETVRKRFALAKLLKSFNNMMLLDNNEEYVVQNNSFAGLPELLNKFMTIVAAASDIPATRMLGQSATGFNATGESDLTNYYDMVSSKQPQMFDKKLEYLDKILAKHMGMPDEHFKYKWNSLYQLSEMDQAELELKRAQRDNIYLGAVITEEIVAKQLKEDGTYTAIDDEYIEELERMAEEDEHSEGEIGEVEEQEEVGESGEDSKGNTSGVPEGADEDSESAEE